MPTVRHKPPLDRVSRQIDKLLSGDGRDIAYVSLGFFCALFEFKQANRLTWLWVRGFFQACEFIEYKGDISKTTLFDYLGEKYNHGSFELPESIALFFSRDPASRRFTLSDAGKQAKQEWNTTLRRVLLDEKERYRLLYDRWNKEEIARRKKQKRFFELATDEQIRIARAFFSMPRTTPEELEHVKAAQKYLYMNFDVRPNDLKTLAKQYPIIQAARHMPTQEAGPADLTTRFRRPEHYKKAEESTNTQQPPNT